MTAPVQSGGLLESVSRGLLAVGDVFRRSWKWLSVVGLVAILVICVGYVMFGTLKVNPIESEYQVKVQLHESGGLLPNQEVTLRGVPIGRVESVNLDKGGVVAIAAINGSVKLPVDSEVRVSVVNGLGKSSGGNGSNGIVFGDIVKQSDQLMGTLNGRSAQIQNSLDKTSQLASTLSAREKTINDLLESGAPALKAIDPHQVTDLADTAGHISDQLAKFPSIQGTDSRSMITDFNTIARAFNDVTVSPDTSLVALNRLLPILIKANAGSALAVDVNMAKLALGNWPDAGYKGDPTFHGPKQADWGYLVGSFKYSLYRLQERVVGQGPNPPAPAPAPQPEPQPAPAPEPGPGR
ncbi:Putative Mce family protein [Mycobacteroides abscessus]|nr:Putative Mce family protein [Mycobacteroides abscessus]